LTDFRFLFLISRMTDSELKRIISENRSNYSKIIKRRDEKLYNEVNSIEGDTFSERLYFYLNGSRGRCKECGNITKYEGINNGYREFCSKSCVNKNIEIKQRIKEKLQFKYGIDNISKLEFIKNKKKEGFNKKYGVGSPVELDSVKERGRAATHEYISRNKKSILYKLKEGRRNAFILQCFNGMRLGETIIPMFNVDTFTSISDRDLKFKCIKCGNVFHHHLKWGVRPICWKCQPRSIFQKNVFDFLENLGLNPRFNVRNVIGGELDIFIPQKMVAIECNGVYWHSHLRKDQMYHLNKTIQCEDLGIKLIHVFEGELNNRLDEIKNNIFNFPVNFSHFEEDIVVDRRLYNKVYLKEVGLDVVKSTLPEKKNFGGHECWDCGILYCRHNERSSIKSYKIQ
jgi:endogenous inhibitor of DNA gyrase (YacG/DUF329 family)